MIRQSFVRGVQKPISYGLGTSEPCVFVRVVSILIPLLWMFGYTSHNLCIRVTVMRFVLGDYISAPLSNLREVFFSGKVLKFVHDQI